MSKELAGALPYIVPVVFFIIVLIGGFLLYALKTADDYDAAKDRQQQQPNPSGLVLSAKKAQDRKDEKEFFEKNSQFFR